MDSFKDEGLPENIRCLATHKIKARMLKNNMMRDKISRKDDNLAAKIIKYETFLSQNMIQKIKTEDLVEFQDQVHEYCSKKKNLVPIKTQGAEKTFNIHSLLEAIKRQVKEKIKFKRRSKTSQNPDEKFILLAKPTQLLIREMSESQNSKNKQIVRGLSMQSTQLRGKQKQIGLKGKIMTKNLINVIEKMQEMKYFSQKTGRKLALLVDDRQSPQKLKQQKERLNTAAQNIQGDKFTPMGKICEQNKKPYQSQDMLIVTHMPRINKSIQQNQHSKIFMAGRKKLSQLRKSTLKMESQRGINFKKKRQSAQNQNTRIQADIQNDQQIAVDYF